jgi:cytochrome c oxidase cbb3-type subunit 1
VIFAFGGNVLIASSFYVVQRTCRVLLVAGSLIMAWNVWKTITSAEAAEEEALPAQSALVAAE